MATPILSQPLTIPQLELAAYITRANKIDALKAEQLALEQSLTTALANGFKVESGTHTANLKTTERRNVSWRGVVERLKGSGYVQQVLSHTKPKTFTKLIVR